MNSGFDQQAQSYGIQGLIFTPAAHIQCYSVIGFDIAVARLSDPSSIKLLCNPAGIKSVPTLIHGAAMNMNQTAQDAAMLASYW